MRNLLEEIGYYAIKKFLAFLVKKYSLKDDRDALDHIAFKMDSKKK